MSRTNIAAFTATKYEGYYPPYISINEVDGLVEITIRSPEKNGSEGSMGVITLSSDEYAALISAPPVAVGALQSEGDSAYCRYLDKMSEPPCLGAEYKLKAGKFGLAELTAHTVARELYGFHRGIERALAALAQDTGATPPSDNEEKAL